MGGKGRRPKADSETGIHPVKADRGPGCLCPRDAEPGSDPDSELPSAGSESLPKTRTDRLHSV